MKNDQFLEMYLFRIYEMCLHWCGLCIYQCMWGRVCMQMHGWSACGWYVFSSTLSHLSLFWDSTLNLMSIALTKVDVQWIFVFHFRSTEVYRSILPHLPYCRLWGMNSGPWTIFQKLSAISYLQFWKMSNL